jgi:histidinol-phosphate aminotransferase
MIRKEVELLTPYAVKVYPCRIKLNQNESPFEPSEDAKKEFVRRLGEIGWCRYPALVPKSQIAKTAEFAGWIEDGVLMGNGSNEILYSIFLGFLERGRSVVISQPTYTLYKILAQTLGATVHDVMMTQDFAFDVDRLILTANQSKASLIVLCSPNNPTGAQLRASEVQRILESTQSTLLLDEAYVHFAPANMVPLLSRYERLIIMQTFSKAIGAAGVRFGYALCWPDVARQIEKIMLPYHVNIFTLLAIDILMDDRAHIQKCVELLKSERTRMLAGLSAIPGVLPHLSEGNYMMFEVLKRKPADVFQSLVDRGILIRDVSSYPMLERALRVTIGAPDENREFLRVLREVV